jgi:hypothetical protein
VRSDAVAAASAIWRPGVQQGGRGAAMSCEGRCRTAPSRWLGLGVRPKAGPVQRESTTRFRPARRCSPRASAPAASPASRRPRVCVRVHDPGPRRDRDEGHQSFSITIQPPRPLVITNQSDALSPGTLGEFYCCENLFADGGVPDCTWTSGVRPTTTRPRTHCEPGPDHGHSDPGRHVHVRSPRHRLARDLRRAYVSDHDQLTVTRRRTSSGADYLHSWSA